MASTAIKETKLEDDGTSDSDGTGGMSLNYKATGDLPEV